MSNVTRSEADLMALRFLRDHGLDTIGIIDSEESLAAAPIYADLVKRSLRPGEGIWSYAEHVQT